jgi:hypothetical protein
MASFCQLFSSVGLSNVSRQNLSNFYCTLGQSKSSDAIDSKRKYVNNFFKVLSLKYLPEHSTITHHPQRAEQPSGKMLSSLQKNWKITYFLLVYFWIKYLNVYGI